VEKPYYPMTSDLMLIFDFGYSVVMQSSHQRKLRIVGCQEDVLLFDNSVNDLFGYQVKIFKVV
jgi:hypothetical protein